MCATPWSASARITISAPLICSPVGGANALPPPLAGEGWGGGGCLADALTETVWLRPGLAPAAAADSVPVVGLAALASCFGLGAVLVVCVAMTGSVGFRAGIAAAVGLSSGH